MHFSNCDEATALANITQITGASDARLFQQQPEAVYPYRDEDGRVLFEKLRYRGKRFVQRATGADGRPVYAKWPVPDDATTGIVRYTVTAKDPQGRTGEYKPFDVNESQITIVAERTQITQAPVK